MNKQSTDNLLVNAANVDAFLEGRRPRHVWSHQLRVRPGGSGGVSADPAIAGRPATVGASALAGAAASEIQGAVGTLVLYQVSTHAALPNRA